MNPLKDIEAQDKIDIVIVGSGNIALHLSWSIWESKNLNLKEIKARDLYSLNDFPPCLKTNDFTTHKKCDLVLLAISDDAIETVSDLEMFEKDLLVHVSGGKNINSIKTSRKGVFYIPYSFSKAYKTKLVTLPVCIEANNKHDNKLLIKLAHALKLNSVEMDSQKRLFLHASAVMTNNFINHLMFQAEVLAEKGKFDIKLLEPLIKQGLDKSFQLGAIQSQTGPARRKDEETIKTHLELLDEDQKELYKLFTRLIQKQYE